MDNVTGQQESDVRQSKDFLSSSLKFFDRIEKWLAGFFEMTQEEQRNAGIQFPDEHDDQPHE